MSLFMEIKTMLLLTVFFHIYCRILFHPLLSTNLCFTSISVDDTAPELALGSL